MNRAIVIPESWSKQADFFIARLDKFQPCFCTIPIPDSAYSDSDHFLSIIYSLLAPFKESSALIVLPKSWAKIDKMEAWPALICKKNDCSVVCSNFFADDWQEVEKIFQEFIGGMLDTVPKTHLTCQYQPPYTTMLEIWGQAGAEEFHPGDYFQSEILTAISQMTGNWVYWGHGEANLLRGYGYLKKEELLMHKPTQPLNATLWFTCSTLEKKVSGNIALSWYLSGATKCLLASPYKVKTKANQLLSAAWLVASQTQKQCSIAGIILKLLEDDSLEIKKVLSKYYLLGNPWVLASI